MPLQIQGGSVSDRIRSLFKLRGRTLFSLDEVVVPTVNVEDLSGPPWTGTTSKRFAVSKSVTQDASAPLQRVALLINRDASSPSVAPQKQEDKDVAVIDQIMVQLQLAPDVGTASPSGWPLSVGMYTFDGWVKATDPVGQSIQYGTVIDAGSDVAGQDNWGDQVRVALYDTISVTPPVAPGNRGPICRPVLTWTKGTATDLLSLYLPILQAPVAIGRNRIIGINLENTSTTTQFILRIDAFGRYYPAFEDVR